MIAGGCLAAFLLLVFFTLFCRPKSVCWKVNNSLALITLIGGSVVTYLLLDNEA